MKAEKKIFVIEIFENLKIQIDIRKEHRRYP